MIFTLRFKILAVPVAKMCGGLGDEGHPFPFLAKKQKKDNVELTKSPKPPNFWGNPRKVAPSSQFLTPKLVPASPLCGTQIIAFESKT